MYKINLVIFLCLNAFANAQNFDFIKYRASINEAKINMYYKKNYNSALIYYKEAIKFGNENVPDLNDYLDMAVCYLTLNDTVKAMECVKISVLKGNVDIEEQTWLRKMFSLSQWLTLKGSFEKLKNEYWCNLKNKDNYMKIAKLEAADQTVRTNFENKLPPKEFDRLMGIIDSVNLHQLKKLVETQEANPLCFLLYHLYDENQKYFAFYDSIYKSKIFTGEANPSAYAQWVDRQRIYVEKKQTQLYGEFNEFGSDEFNPIADISNVDQRRTEIGLCTLEDYALINGLKLPKGYLKNKK